MPLSKGDFVLVEYEVRVKETGELLDTTSEEEAKKAGIYDASERYGPRLVIIGEGRLVKGLEKALEGMNEGEEKEVEIPPEEAYGPRDPSKIKIIPLARLARLGITPEPGKVVEIDGKMAVIRSITGGRVLVDFNHPLAGKTLKARVKVVKVLKDVAEKIKHLILRRVVKLSPDDVNVAYKPNEKLVEIKLADKALEVSDLQIAKRIIVAEISRFMRGEVEKVRFIEEVSLQKTS